MGRAHSADPASHDGPWYGGNLMMLTEHWYKKGRSHSSSDLFSWSRFHGKNKAACDISVLERSHSGSLRRAAAKAGRIPVHNVALKRCVPSVSVHASPLDC